MTPANPDALADALAQTMWEQSHEVAQKASWNVAQRLAGHLPDGQVAWSLTNVRRKAAEIVAGPLAPLLAAKEAAEARAAQLQAEVGALKADRDDAVRMLDVWFDTSTKTNEQVVPQLVDALVGYLRTCRCGGMPAETSDMIEAGAADFIRRRAGYIIAPVIETMVADRTADLRVEVEGLKAALKPHQAPPLSTALAARAATAGEGRADG